MNELALAYPKASLRYHRPPRPGDPRRHGEAKAGNLNSALALLPPEIEFVETRDADDLVGDRHFLRETVGQLLAAENVAFVQTCKAGQVAPHDPFDNHQPHFFQCAMLSRYAANAVFPCGSGMVWRRKALHEIGDFPTWNLVEDLQSGLEALRRGWEGCYLPILGAYAQHSPEDLPNFVKQRGTWALDTREAHAVGAEARAQRCASACSSTSSACSTCRGPPRSCSCWRRCSASCSTGTPSSPRRTTSSLHFWPFVVALELYLVLVHRPDVPRAAVARTTGVGGPLLRRMPAHACSRSPTGAHASRATW